MSKKQDKPQALPDEQLDEAAGGLLPAVKQYDLRTGYDAGFAGGVRVATGDVNNDGAALKIADGSVKPGA